MTPDMQSSGVRYSGTKTLTAWPMTRGEYNAYRTWTPPEGEDQTTAGYLVEYADGGAANDSRHVGYISWSPADVFERSYKAIGTFQDRVRTERADLNEKLDKLTAFRAGPAWAGIPNDERERLIDQGDAMLSYLEILDERIAAFEPAHAVG
jgi:hypothetical protein